MRRRDFLILSAAAVAWPKYVGAQQSEMPVIGILSLAAPDAFAHLFAAYHEGLRGAGFVEGENVMIEYRWARGHYDQLPALAADLVNREVTVIVASGGDRPSLAAKAATTTIPIVFTGSDDPVGFGLVKSLSHPGGNMTGIAGSHLNSKSRSWKSCTKSCPRRTESACWRTPTIPPPRPT